ncbi:MAG: hypothetical protein QG641_2624 [Candidatus Poribacteria bacterium]|nr:hypothetical protein [Candidatus Poribacteria bacterium]
MHRIIVLSLLLFFLVVPLYAQWESVFVPIESGTLVKIAFIGDRGWIGSYRGNLLRTDDGGNNWQEIAKLSAISDFHFINKNEGWLSGSGLWRTHDGGETWTSLLSELDARNTPLDFPWIKEVIESSTPLQIYFFDSNNGVGIYEWWHAGGGAWVEADVIVANTQDGGEHWLAKKWIAGIRKWPGGRFHIDVINDRIWLLVWGMWFSSDRGETWSDLSTPGAISNFDFLNPNDGWSNDGEGQCFRTRDGGVTWEKISQIFLWTTSALFFASQQSGWLLMFPYREDRIYHAELLETHDGGIIWQTVPLPVDSQSRENDPRGLQEFTGGFALNNVNGDLWIYLRNFSVPLFRGKNIFGESINSSGKLTTTWGKVRSNKSGG